MPDPLSRLGRQAVADEIVRLYKHSEILHLSDKDDLSLDKETLKAACLSIWLIVFKRT